MDILCSVTTSWYYVREVVTTNQYTSNCKRKKRSVNKGQVSVFGLAYKKVGMQ